MSRAPALLLVAAAMLAGIDLALVVDRSQPASGPVISGVEPAAEVSDPVVARVGPTDGPSGSGGTTPSPGPTPTAAPAGPAPADTAPTTTGAASDDEDGVSDHETVVPDAGYARTPVSILATFDHEHYYAGEPVITDIRVCNQDDGRSARYVMQDPEGEFSFAAGDERGFNQVHLIGGRPGTDGEVRELAPGGCTEHRFVWDRTRDGAPVAPGPWQVSGNWAGFQLEADRHPTHPEPAWIQLHDEPRPPGPEEPVPDDRDLTYDVTVHVEVPGDTFRVGEDIPFTIRLCNETDRDLTWGYPETLERPVQLGLHTGGDHPVSAGLRNGYEARGGVGEAQLHLAARSCVPWRPIWKQTRGQFEMDGSGTGEPFGTGTVMADVVADGGCIEYHCRIPDAATTFTITS